MTNWRNWFANMWSVKGRAVAASCQAIKRDHPLFLADLALRGNVYAPLKGTDPIMIARELGRRDLALETIKLCDMDPAALKALLDPLPQPQKSPRGGER